MTFDFIKRFGPDFLLSGKFPDKSNYRYIRCRNCSRKLSSASVTR